MKGWRTILFNAAGAILPALQGLDLTSVLSAQQMGVYGVVIGLVNIGLRAITTTPIGTK